jgi:cytochrome c
VLPPSLKDQRGNPVYFEIRLNRVFVDYIVANKLYDAESQAKLTQVDAPPGSILVKAAWRVLGPDESDFYSTEALVPAHPLSGSSEKRRVKVGLVGFHIMHKTPSAPQWIWSTFEHVRNVNGPDASFHNVRCVDGAVNIQTPDGVPNQVTRVIPIPDGDPHLPEINKTVRAALAPSVFQHYEQIGTQWPVPASTEQEHPTVFEVRPALLGNTVLETYIQNTSSCMGCHAMARTVNAAQFVSSDFTFTLAQARPGQKEPGVIDPPRSPSNYDDLASWASILRGYQIATSTYETLPEYLPQSKLHCQSCHLNAGGNPRASWWVGMIAKYSPYGSGMFLQDRINQCFTRSMNGNALQPAPSVPNPDMNALIAYMSWLDRQQKAQGLAMPTSAFPPIKTTLKVDSTRGGKIYLQKCAFCHGADGQGRYESGTYYRPALWGPHSYNQQAGMFRMPDLAAFVKSNMPFGSGGELTEQEAWDLAAFINDSKLNNRPVGQNPPDKKPQ